eukprot:2505929-Amphidinium_carterae.1
MVTGMGLSTTPANLWLGTSCAVTFVRNFGFEGGGVKTWLWGKVGMVFSGAERKYCPIGKVADLLQTLSQVSVSWDVVMSTRTCAWPAPHRRDITGTHVHYLIFFTRDVPIPTFVPEIQDLLKTQQNSASSTGCRIGVELKNCREHGDEAVKGLCDEILAKFKDVECSSFKQERKWDL